MHNYLLLMHTHLDSYNMNEYDCKYLNLNLARKDFFLSFFFFFFSPSFVKVLISHSISLQLRCQVDAWRYRFSGFSMPHQANRIDN